MPSNGAKPFFLESSLLDQCSHGMKLQIGVGKTSNTDLKEMENSSVSVNSSPSTVGMSTSVLGLHLRQEEQFINNNPPTRKTFQGFQLDLPWAPHLSGINIGPTEMNSVNDSSRVKSLPFDYDVQLGNYSRTSPGSCSSQTRLHSLPINSRCFSLARQQKREKASTCTNLNIKQFQSLSNVSRKRSYCEISSEESACARSAVDSLDMKRQRFLRTAEALNKSGLLNVTMKSAALIQQNRNLQREIEQLKKETVQFMKSVLSNPENQHLLPVGIST